MLTSFVLCVCVWGGVMQVLMRVVFNPCIYMDKVAVVVQEAVCLQAKIRGQDRNTNCVPISHIDGELSYSFIDVVD